MIEVKKIVIGISSTLVFIILGLTVTFYGYVNPKINDSKIIVDNTKDLTVPVSQNQLPEIDDLDNVISLKNKSFDNLMEVFRLINKPIPLNNLASVVSSNEITNTNWSTQEIINLTNQTRLDNNLPLLRPVSVLNEVALFRLEDMFTKGYFNHSSPSGEGVEKVVDKFGYQYLTLGENLALGDFVDHQDIINAWLNSPAHRDNLLALRYKDTGTAIREGLFNGRKVIMVVQVFGSPLTSCQFPSLVTKNKILSNKNKLQSLETPLNQLNRVIENPESTNLLARQRNISEYNRLAKGFNTLIDDTRQMILDYNRSVEIFNNCVKLEMN